MKSKSIKKYPLNFIHSDMLGCATHKLKNNPIVLTVISRFVLLVAGYNVLIINFDAIIVQNNQCLERGQTVCAV